MFLLENLDEVLTGGLTFREPSNAVRDPVGIESPVDELEIPLDDHGVAVAASTVSIPGMSHHQGGVAQPSLDLATLERRSTLRGVDVADDNTHSTSSLATEHTDGSGEAYEQS